MDKNNNLTSEELTSENFESLINIILDDINKDNTTGAFFYAFKTNAIPNCKNQYITLDYDFYDTCMPAKVVIETVIKILIYLRDVKISTKKDTVFSKYNINNPKNVIDYINMEKYDFNNKNISSGIEEGLNSDSYKIEYLLNCIESNYCVAKNEKDYKGLKHSALKLTTKSNKIVIINKSSPIYRQRSLMYIVDFPKDEQEYNNICFKPINDTLFTIPFYPHVLIINNYCFFIADKIESIFGFEEFNKRQAQKFIEKLPEKTELDLKSIECIKAFIAKGKNYNYFANFDKSRLNSLKNKNAKIINIIKKKLNVPFNENNIPVISNLDQSEAFIGFLCGDVKEDIYSGDEVIALNCKRLNIKKD